MHQFRDFVHRIYDVIFPFALMQRYKRVLMYLFFGSMAAIVDVGVYIILFNFFGFAALYANSVSQALAILCGFFLNGFITFKVSDKYKRRLLLFILVSLTGYLVTSVILYLFHDMLRFDGNLVKILSLPLIFVLQYTLNSLITFRSSSR